MSPEELTATAKTGDMPAAVAGPVVLNTVRASPAMVDTLPLDMI